MSRQIRPITMSLFYVLFKEAQRIHAENDEPIPSLTNESQAKIESCLSAPFQTLYGQQVLPGFIPKAAALFYYIAKGHPLGNGNKRMACLTMFYLCAINGRMLRMDDAELVELSKEVASSDPIDKDKVELHIRKVLNRKIKPLSQLIRQYKKR